MKSLGVDIPTLTQFCRTEGRVLLEAQAPLWHSSISRAQSRSLARAQRLAMAAITSRWHPSHSKQLQELALEPLDARRTRLCRRFAERTARRSRHQDMFPLGWGPDSDHQEDGEAALPGAPLQDGQLPSVSCALPGKMLDSNK